MSAKRVALIVPATLLGLVGLWFLAWWLWFNVFYYRSYNALKQELEAIPNLKIIDDWCHEDITVEDCFFEVVVGDSESIELHFYGVSRWRSSFHQLDGIIVSWRLDPTINGNLRTALSVSDLRTVGVDATRLSKALQSTDTILDLARRRPATTGPLGIHGNWITVYSRELNRNANKANQAVEATAGPLGN